LKTNILVPYIPIITYEGGKASRQTPETELRRAVSTCLLWEDTFYEKGNDIATRIADLCAKVKPEVLRILTIEAKTHMKLRHVPLWLIVQAIRLKSPYVKELIVQVVHRPDEMSELLSLYWKDGRKPLAAQLKKGLAAVFTSFSSYSLAKWNKDSAIKLKDVMFLTHPKPINNEQAQVWKQLIDGTLASPDTWEVALSSGKDKRETWERLLREKKLGYMALLMNLRNMEEASVDRELVDTALKNGAHGSKALPFRFISAYKHAPSYADSLSEAMEMAIEGHLEGETAIVIDVSGSMSQALSGKSTIARYEAATALAILIRAITPKSRVFLFDTSCIEIPNIRGLGLLAHINSKLGGGTNIAQALKYVQTKCDLLHRVVLITDEQAHDGIHPLWTKYGYIINIAPYKPGLDTNGSWVRINGFSEHIVDWIINYERGE
jgi:hypothetical protein